MRRTDGGLMTAIIALLLVFATSGAMAQKKKKGFVLTSRDGNFTVILPAGFDPPTRNIEDSENDHGTITATTYTTGNQRGACLVNFTSYPDEIFEQATSEVMLDGARDGALQGNEESLESQEDYMFGAYNARTVIFASTTDDGTPLYSKFVWIIARPFLYQVAFVAYDRDDLDAADITKYFDSFKITKKKKGK
jgi:hypothetical protein